MSGEPRMTEELDFGEFYAASFRRVVGQVYTMTGNLAEAEDAVQEAFARAWQRWKKVREYNEPESWVRTVAYRISVSAWRKAANRFVAHQRAGGGAGAQPDLSPDRLALVGALRQIPAEQRRAIVLYHLVGLSVEEVARETGAPVGTVKTRLACGRRALAPMVSEFADQPAAPGSGNGATTAASGA
ncbi:MAG TPA: SigE family RNA polymerase sigma factor [Actinocrinis sp.]